MRQIYNIARAELQSFFYSPIAWLILVIFTVLCAVSWCDAMTGVTRAAAQGMAMPGLTDFFLTSPERTTFGPSVFGAAVKYLYIFYPLLTMGLISRELANGSIRLLDSSPVTPAQVVLGKLAGMAVYSLLLAAVLFAFVVPGAVVITGFNWGHVLVALLGVLLTMLAYSAIGIFFSSLTRYPVVAAIGALAAFMVLENVGGYGQRWEVVRDIASWLSLSGKTAIFLRGMLASHHVVYFLGIIAMFTAFTVLRLHLAHYHYTPLRQAVRYLAVVAAVLAAGWLTSRPALRLYADVTANKANTISEQSRQVMEQLRDKGRLTVTTCVNLMDRTRVLPEWVSGDKASFERYQRFKPDMDFRYVYYYAPTDVPTGIERMKPGLTFEETARELARILRIPFRRFKTKEEIDRVEDLAPEHYRFVRILELENGRRSVLRMYDEIPPVPSEREIATAFRRLAGDVPCVGFVTGHGERSIYDGTPTGYERVVSDIFYRNSLLTQGVDGVEVRLAPGGIPDSMDILVIADPQSPFTDTELAELDAYIARGGNLLLLVEPESHAATSTLLERFGVELEPGRLAQAPAIELADVVGTYFTGELDGLRLTEVVMPGVAALRPGNNTGFERHPVLSTRADTWNKIGPVDWIQGDINPSADRGERMGPFVTGVALTREVGGKQQRVMITGDADWMDNREIRQGRQGFNSSYSRAVHSVFKWFTYGMVPMDTGRPPVTDTSIAVSQREAVWYKWIMEFALPGLMLVFGAVVLIRRNRK